MGCYTLYLVRELDGQLWWNGAKWGPLLFASADELLAHLDKLDRHPVGPDFQLERWWCRGWFLDRRLRFARAYSCQLEDPRQPIGWSGWDAQWAREGLFDVAYVAGVASPNDDVAGRLDDWAGCAAGRLLTRHPDRERFLYRWSEEKNELAYAWYYNDGADISVIRPDGQVRDYGFDDPYVLFEALGRGPELLEELWREAPCPYPASRECGAVIDEQQHTLHYWLREQVASSTRAELARRWPGWTVAREPRGEAGHLERTGRAALEEAPYLRLLEGDTRALQFVATREVPEAEVAQPPLDPEEGQLLAAVYADLASDAPRQVYADFLLARGDGRGALINVQCALVALEKADVRSPERARLEKTQTRLLRTYGHGPMGPAATVSLLRRGFPAIVSVHGLADFVRSGELERHPTIEELQVSSRGDVESLLALLASPGFGSVRALHLSAGAGDIALVFAPGARSLRRLALSSEEPTLGPELMRALPGALSQLEELSLGGAAFDADCVVGALARLPCLRRLSVYRCDVGDVGALQLARMPELARLALLSLDNCRVGTEGRAALVACLGDRAKV